MNNPHIYTRDDPKDIATARQVLTKADSQAQIKCLDIANLILIG